MNKSDPRLEQLRARAEKSLSSGSDTHDARDEHETWEPAPAPADLDTVLNELRIYHAELEIQNSELVNSQLAEANLRKRYQLLFGSLPLAAFVVNDLGIIEEANEQAAQTFGFRTMLTMRKHSLLRLIVPEHATALIAGLRRGDSSLSRLPWQLRFVKADGSEIPMEVHLCVLPSAYHLDRHFLLLCLDRSADAELALQQTLFKTLLDNSNAMVFAFDREGRCMLANKAMHTLLGCDESEVLGHRRHEWLSKSDADQHEHNDQLVMTNRQAMLYEEKFHRPGEEVRYFLSQKFPLFDPDNELIGVGCVTTDITDARQKDIRLELAAQLFRAGTEGIVITSPDEEIVSVNQAFTQITGYEEHEVLGEKPALLASGRHDKDFYRAMWNEINADGKWEGEIWNRRKNGEIYPEWLAISRVCSPTGETTHYIGVFSDITHRKLAEEEIERLAFYDPLTGTPNRYLLHDRAAQAIKTAERNNGRFALCFVDLDRFKTINDVYSHEVGDELLKEIANRIQGNVLDNDTVCRLGGDEFVLLIEGLSDVQLERRVQAIISAIGQPFTFEDTEIALSASMGIALYPHDGRSFSELMRQADMAMYQAKNAGRNAWRYFNDDMARLANEHLSFEIGLKRALAKHTLSLRFQPQIDLQSHQISGAEALLRWRPEGGGAFVSPEQFIPIAEETGLIVEIGLWAIDQAVMQRKRWLDAGHRHFVMAVNVSFVQFWRDDFVDEVRKILTRHQLPAKLLEIELTERVAMKNADRAVSQMRALKALGLRLSIDDFGTGYSSLAYLNAMPIDSLKVDRAFIRDIGLDPQDEAICKTIILLAETIGLSTVAEGIETPAQLEFLIQNRCSTGQGYYFAHPLMSADFELELLSKGDCVPHGST